MGMSASAGAVSTGDTIGERRSSASKKGGASAGMSSGRSTGGSVVGSCADAGGVLRVMNSKRRADSPHFENV
jgi:hypothetical protein